MAEKMDDVEQVARALAIAHATDPDEEIPGERFTIEDHGITRIITSHRGPLWKMWTNDAQAVITAHKAWLKDNGWAIVPKKASDKMAIAGWVIGEHHEEAKHIWTSHAAALVWAAMLKEGEMTPSRED